MAGLGFKDFQVGEVLTSADVDGYLMQQTVMRFADAGARGSALGTATGTAVPLAEGMVSYLDDVNQVQVYNGTAWTAAGRLAQVVQTVRTDTFTESVAQGAVSGDAITASITPSSSASKVLVVAHLSVGQSADNQTTPVLYRAGSVTTFIGDADGNRQRVTTGNPNFAFTPMSVSFMALDSPATTSATTYSVRIGHNAAATQTIYLNRSASDTNADTTARAISTLTLMEVAA